MFPFYNPPEDIGKNVEPFTHAFPANIYPVNVLSTVETVKKIQETYSKLTIKRASVASILDPLVLDVH